MKKIVAIIICILCILSLCACGSKAEPDYLDNEVAREQIEDTTLAETLSVSLKPEDIYGRWQAEKENGDIWRFDFCGGNFVERRINECKIAGERMSMEWVAVDSYIKIYSEDGSIYGAIKFDSVTNPTCFSFLPITEDSTVFYKVESDATYS